MQTPPTIPFLKYLLYAIYIVRTSPAILGVLVLLGIIDGAIILLPEGTLSNNLSVITMVAAFFISPLVYGHYYERIENQTSSIVTIFRTYVPGYVLLLFCIYIPITIATTAVSQAAGDTTNMAYIMLSILVFSLLFIYVVPCYFISGKISDAMGYGLSFFIKNMYASAPLLLMALFSDLLLMLTHYQFSWLLKINPQLFAIFEFIIYLIASITDFLLFIILIYILKEQPDIPKRCEQGKSRP